MDELRRVRNLGGAAVEAIRRWPAWERSEPAPARPVGRRSGWLGIGIVGVLLAIAWLESRTSMIEARLLATTASLLHYRIEPGPSDNIQFPRTGPLDTERGYSHVPRFVEALKARGFEVRAQSRFSPGLGFLSRIGIPPPYRPTPVAGLVIRDMRGDTLFDGAEGHPVFHAYDEIPPLVVRSLLFIENRQLRDGGSATRNPAIDWGRSVKAAGLWIGRHVGLPLRLEGGSTLAVQLVKYDHSSEGRTHTPVDKLRQIAAASLAAYRGGANTEQERRDVVLDYLNTVPLAATPERGEISGLEDGLRAWFGLDPDRVRRALEYAPVRARAAAYRPVLALLCAAQAPTRDLLQDREGLERRVDAYARLLEKAGVIDPELANATRDLRLEFAHRRAPHAAPLDAEHKPAYVVRRHLSDMLGIPNLYDVDRLDLQVQTTLDDSLQARTLRLFRALADTAFVARHGLRGEHLLATGDPAGVVYSLMLFESTPGGARACAYVDNLDAPFDPNSGMKLELGSTAKLRTLAHYLQIVEELHRDLGRDRRTLRALAGSARDPITAWAARTLASEPAIGLDRLLNRALDRSYSANAGETFFTGGGVHAFHNFDPSDDRRTLSVREALVHSTNLVFVRLMRDIVRYHEAHLPYDFQAVMVDTGSADRRRLLKAAADEESRSILWRAYQREHGNAPGEIEQRVRGRDPASVSRAAALFYAWRPGAPADSLGAWLGARFPDIAPGELDRLARGFGNPAFTLLDYAYLLRLHPLELWCAGELARAPEASFDTLWANSAEPRRLCSAWLLDARHPHAQEIRLRTQIEREAFEQMTPEWRKLGFPFQHLVPSLATAIGASGDRPAALAELMGVVLADGLRRPTLEIEQLVFGANTPYHTALEATPQRAERLLSAGVARTLRSVLAEVVARGTARRVDGTFVAPDGTPLPIGGKTGSGDNRLVSFASGRRPTGSRATSRTATFVFYLGDHHYGVITASVWGPRARDYRFTSSLPLSVLRLLAPAIEDHLRADHGAEAVELGPLAFAPKTGGR